MAVTDQTGEASKPIIEDCAEGWIACELNPCPRHVDYWQKYNKQTQQIPENQQPESAKEPTPLPQQMTLRQFRALRGKYFTVKHKRMEPCGHRLDQITEPRSNCEFCWFAFFQTHGQLVQTADRAYQEQGVEFLDKIRGQKWRKMFLRFMSTVAMFQKEMEAAKGKTDGQAGENQSSVELRQSIGQAIRDERYISNNGSESGPTSSDIPDPIAIV